MTFRHLYKTDYSASHSCTMATNLLHRRRSIYTPARIEPKTLVSPLISARYSKLVAHVGHYGLKSKSSGELRGQGHDTWLPSARWSVPVLRVSTVILPSTFRTRTHACKYLQSVYVQLQYISGILEILRMTVGEPVLLNSFITICPSSSLRCTLAQHVVYWGIYKLQQSKDQRLHLVILHTKTKLWRVKKQTDVSSIVDNGDVQGQCRPSSTFTLNCGYHCNCGTPAYLAPIRRKTEFKVR